MKLNIKLDENNPYPPEGGIPEDNPFPGSPVYSLGHRNPQGFDWHPLTGDLFSSEHGPSGENMMRGHDIVNVIYPGKNYGWPEVVGQVNREEFEDPLVLWVETTPPAGIAFWNNELFVSTLRSQTLVRVGLEVEENSYRVTLMEHWFATERNRGRYGRLRDAVVGPDGALHVLTSNRDGRGRPHETDDRILKITNTR